MSVKFFFYVNDSDTDPADRQWSRVPAMRGSGERGIGDINCPDQSRSWLYSAAGNHMPPVRPKSLITILAHTLYHLQICVLPEHHPQTVKAMGFQHLLELEI
jgi:hypothetical protein